MSEGTQTVQQQTQDEQYLQQAQDFFGQSMGRIKGQMQSDSAQLQSFMQQLPPDAQAQVQEMTDSYSQFEGTIDQAAQDAGVQDSLEESAQQARQNADQASGQGPTDVAAEQAQQVRSRPGHRRQVTDRPDRSRIRRRTPRVRSPIRPVRSRTRPRKPSGDVSGSGPGGRVTGGSGRLAGQMAESLPEGYEALGQPFTDDQGNTILQGQDEEGNTAIVRRGTDEAGNTIDSIFDAQGNLLDENIIEGGLPKMRPRKAKNPRTWRARWPRPCPRATR